jgi:GNAT superfamily N-acetyltransferase
MKAVSMRWDNYEISTDPERLDLEAICSFLERSYWANTRPRQVIERSLQNSLCFGLYNGDQQIGFARVVTDYATFAWLCDVFIHEDYRGQGLGKRLMSAVVSHPDLQGLRRWMLATRDAHGLYRQYGFRELKAAERWMERLDS